MIGFFDVGPRVSYTDEGSNGASQKKMEVEITFILASLSVDQFPTESSPLVIVSASRQANVSSNFEEVLDP